MCELMGLCFARPVSADFSIHEFAGRDEDNADGWGMAWYPDQSVTIIKEPRSWRSSGHTGFLETYHGLLSPIYLAHVRHMTMGTPTHADTHPFVREWGGRDYCFAHNGTLLSLADEYPLGRFRPVGRTDSEYAFCHLLEELANRDKPLDDEKSWRWLHAKLKSLNSLGKLNCLLSDGRRLFCYHDVNGWKGLSFRRVQIRDEEPRRFGDCDLAIQIEGGTVNSGFVVATHALSASGWHAFQHGELMVFENGAICFSSRRAPLP